MQFTSNTQQELKGEQQPMTKLDEILEDYIKHVEETKSIRFNIDENTVHIFRQALIKLGKKHVLTALTEGVKREEDREREIGKLIDEIDEKFPFNKKAQSTKQLVDMMIAEDKKQKEEEQKLMKNLIFPEKDSAVVRRQKLDKLKKDQKKFKEDPYFQEEVFYSEDELKQKLKEQNDRTFEECENQLGDIKEDLIKDISGLESTAKGFMKEILEFQKVQNKLVESFKDEEEDIKRMENLNRKLYEIYNVGERKKSFTEDDIKRLMNNV